MFGKVYTVHCTTPLLVSDVFFSIKYRSTSLYAIDRTVSEHVIIIAIELYSINGYIDAATNSTKL